MKLTELAQGQHCTVRSPVCNSNKETVVSAHFRSHRLGAGMGIKPDDFFCAFACSACHDLIDGRTQLDNFTRDEIRFWHLMGVVETQKFLLDNGYVVMKWN